MNLKKLIVELFGSQMAAARELGFSDRQVRNWVVDAPDHVALIFGRLRRQEISLRHARRILRSQRSRRVL